MLMVDGKLKDLSTEQLVGIHNLLVDHTKTGEKMTADNAPEDLKKFVEDLERWLDQTGMFAAMNEQEQFELVSQSSVRVDPIVKAKITRAPNTGKKVDKQETVREQLKLVGEEDLLKIVKLSKVPIEKLHEYLGGTTIGFQDVLDIDEALQALSQGEDEDPQTSTSTSEDPKKMPATATAKAATKSTRPPTPASKKTPGGGRRLKVVSPQAKKPTAKPTTRSTEKKAPFADDQKITVKFKTNPKREGSKVFKIYEILKSSATVGDFRKEAISQKLVEDGHGTLKAAVKEKAISIK